MVRFPFSEQIFFFLHNFGVLAVVDTAQSQGGVGAVGRESSRSCHDSNVLFAIISDVSLKCARLRNASFTRDLSGQETNKSESSNSRRSPVYSSAVFNVSAAMSQSISLISIQRISPRVGPP